MADTARLIALAVQQADDGTPGYTLQHPFGESVQVLPRPPRFRATVTFEWDGAMPEEITALLARARANGVAS